MRIEERDGVAILRMEEGKGNAMGPAFVHELGRVLDGHGDMPLVITGQGRTFSAGLELPALMGLARPDMTAFITAYEAAMQRVFELPVPVIAALNGHAIAGGCVLALQCDARIGAAGSWRMGLNEAAIGLGLPALVFETFRARVPASSLTTLALEGRLVEPHDAMALGLLDAVVDPAELEALACERARTLGQAPRAAFAYVKAAIQRPTLEAVQRHGERERERWIDMWFSPATRTRLEAVVARLQK